MYKDYSTGEARANYHTFYSSGHFIINILTSKAIEHFHHYYRKTEIEFVQHTACDIIWVIIYGAIYHIVNLPKAFQLNLNSKPIIAFKNGKCTEKIQMSKDLI